MKIIEVRSDGRGGAIYSKPDQEQVKNILLILEKANKELEEKKVETTKPKRKLYKVTYDVETRIKVPDHEQKRVKKTEYVEASSFREAYQKIRHLNSSSKVRNIKVVEINPDGSETEAKEV